MSEKYMAVWGLSSFVIANVAACLCVAAAIWNAEFAARICGAVAAVATFSFTVAIDRQNTPSNTTQVRRDE